MAVTSFIPSVWEARLMANYSKASIAELITTKPTKIEGNKIVFNKAGDVAIKDYTGSVAWDELTTSSVDLNMDQKKYFAFKVDDVDSIQAAGDLVDAHVENASSALQEDTDSYVLGLYTGAGSAIGNDTTPIVVDSTNAYDNIVDLGTELNKKKVPKANRFVVINSDYLGLLSKDQRFTNQPVVLENGVVEGQRINGLQVVVSEELATNANGDYKVVALHKSAVGYGKQIDEMEALRLESSISDGVRGLTVYGSSVLRPEGMAVLTATIG